MQTAFQPSAFQRTGFQIVATTQATGGYGFGAYDPYRRRKDEEREELAREIAALEAHLAPSIVPRGTIEPDNDLIRLKAQVDRLQASRLPNRARRAVEYARHAQTKESLLLAERALRQLEEQEALAVLLTLALD